MSSLGEMTWKEAVPFINKLYKSFGVKSAILLKNDEWSNIVTVICFSRRKVEDLNHEYRSIEQRLGKIDQDYFKITFQARPIGEFNRVMAELENGHLKVGDIHSKLVVGDPQKIFDRKISHASHVVRLGEYAEYSSYSMTLNMNNSPEYILSNSGISPSALGLHNFSDLARSWLGLDNLGSTVNVHMVIPIYATIGETRYQGGNEIKASLKIDEQLFDDSNIFLTRKGPGDRAPILERIKYDVASCENVRQNGFVYVSLEHGFSGIGLNDIISVSLFHNKLGLLDRQEMLMFRLAAEPSDPISQTFALFDAGKKMEEHLLNPRSAEDFVTSVSLLLERVDLQTLKLGRDETVRENQTEKGSADIFAYDFKRKEILVVDCTIAVPSETKIDKIKSTADYISRKITFPVKPVIVTAKKSPLAKQMASKYDVKILDNTDLEELFGLYKKGPKWYPRAKKKVLEN